MKSKFAVFILSNGRAESMTTLKSLKRCNYSGDYFIIVDDLDSQKDKYIELYGDHVIIFDKKAQAEKMDTMIHTEVLNTVLYARQFSYDKAKEMGYKYFAQFDDDFNEFSIRYESEGKLKGQRPNDMNQLFKVFSKFMEEANVSVCGFGNSGSYIGGLKGRFSKGSSRSVAGAFIFNSEKDLKFRGVCNEDYILSAEYGKTGNLIFEILDISFHTPVRGTNEGGLQNLYDALGGYTRDFYMIIASPSCVTLRVNESGVTSKTVWNNHHPKILNEDQKKVKG